MMVLQLFRSLHPAVGGPLAYYLALEEALRRTAATIAVASLEPVPIVTGIRSAHAGRYRLSLLKAFELWRWLGQNSARYGLVHIHGVFGWHALLAAVMLHRRAIPYVISTHGHLLPNALAQKTAKKGLYLRLVGRRILRSAAAVVATSRLEQQAIHAVTPAATVVIVPPGISAPKAMPRQAPAVDGLELLYLGRLHPHKQIPLLLKALAALPAGFDWRLTLAGDGDERYVAELHKLAGELELGARIAFAGYVEVPEKEALLGRAHLLVLPSLSENFSFAVAEALAHGVPVIVTEEIGLADVVKRYGCGAVVPVRDCAAITTALVALAQPTRLQSAAAAARRCAEAELTVDAMSRSLLALYGQTASGRR